jgi:GNAT superfamily N-acetyltransferase
MTDTPTQVHEATIRRARPEEAGAISELAFRSKGHWGYDTAFLEASREDLTISPQEIASTPVYVHETGDGIAGFYTLLPHEDGTAELDDLFVDPAAIGQGVGRRLWEHAVALAREMGARELVFQSDPHAEGFYQAMGAERAGESESTVIPGRKLPLMRFTFDPE